MDLTHLLSEDAFSKLYSIRSHATIRLKEIAFREPFCGSTSYYRAPDKRVLFFVSSSPWNSPWNREDSNGDGDDSDADEEEDKDSPGPYLMIYFNLQQIDQEEVLVRHSVALLDANGGRRFPKDYLLRYQRDLTRTENSSHMFLSTQEVVQAEAKGVEFQRDGYYVIQVDSFILEANKVNESSSPKSASLANDMKFLFNTGQHSDLILVLNGNEFKVHKNILVARSPYFARLLKEKNRLKECRLEVPSGEGVEVAVFVELLRYMYTGEVDSLSEYAEDLLLEAHLYQMEPLKSLCAEHLISVLNADNFCRLIQLANDLHVENLLSSCMQYFDGNYKAIVKSTDWVKMMATNAEMLARLGQIVAKKI